MVSTEKPDQLQNHDYLQESSQTGKWSDKFSYGTARFASTIFAAYAAYYLMGFCTDVALISPGTTAVILFSLRIFDVINDQFVGVFINRQHFREGKYSPYLKWCALPFALSFMLSAWTPGLGMAGKIAFLVVMLAVCELASTVLNTAELSMLPYLAKNDMDRVKFMSFSNMGAIFAYFVIGTFMLPLVNFFGRDKQTGYVLAMGLFAALSIPAHLWAYWRMKDRRFSVISRFVSIRDMFLTITGNRQLLMFLTGYCLYYLADTFKSQTAYYYMTYNMGRQDLLPVIIMAGILASLAIQPFIPQLLRFANKEILMAAGLFTAGTASILVLAAGTRPASLIVCQILYGLSTAITANLVFTVVASFSDEILEQKKIPMSEILVSIMALSANLGAAISGGVAPLVLSTCGYSAHAGIQTTGALAGIKSLYITCTAAAMALACVFMLLFYFTRNNRSRA